MSQELTQSSFQMKIQSGLSEGRGKGSSQQISTVSQSPIGMSGFYARDAPARFPRSYSIRGATTARHAGEPTTENIVSFPIREPQREPGGGGDLDWRRRARLAKPDNIESKFPCLGKSLLPNRINREGGGGGGGSLPLIEQSYSPDTNHYQSKNI